MRQMPRCAGTGTGRKTRLPGPSSSPLGAAGRLDFIGPKFAESSPLGSGSVNRCRCGMLFWDSPGPCCYYIMLEFLSLDRNIFHFS